MTVISPDVEVTLQEMAERVEKTRREHGELLQRYHEVWYNAPHTWHYTHFLGIGMMKSPNDLWMYQALMNDYRFETVIETGTYKGGSALWFAFLMDILQIPNGRVYTIDIEDRARISHPRITFIDDDSTSKELATWLGAQLRGGPLLVSLDADHSAAHVRKELDLYAPLCKKGDWLVVEDTNIAWVGDEHRVTQTFDQDPVAYHCSCGATYNGARCPNDHSDRGARGGLEDFLRANPGQWRQDMLCERYLLTMHPGGWLQKVGD